MGRGKHLNLRATRGSLCQVENCAQKTHVQGYEKLINRVCPSHYFPPQKNLEATFHLRRRTHCHAHGRSAAQQEGQEAWREVST